MVVSPQLLEAALRAHPSLDPQRWDKIANAVPSRTRRECLARFKVSGELQHARAGPPCVSVAPAAGAGGQSEGTTE